MTRTTFLGVGFANGELAQVASWVEERARQDVFAYLVTPNVDHVVVLREDGAEGWRAAYRAAVAEADLVINDSRVLARLALLSKKRLSVTPGSDLVRELVRRGADGAGTLTLIGGNAGEAEWLRRALPRWRIAHFEPVMGVRDDPREQQRIAEFIECERSDLTLFAIGAPQSEIVAHRVAGRGKARGVGLCIGASVEFLSGAKWRAPAWMQRAGLEWAFRLASEPRRLWRRYLLRGPRVFGIWWAEHRRRDDNRRM